MKPVIDLTKDRHAFMIEHGPAIDEWLNYFVVPIYILGKDKTLDKITETGSGVLLAIDKRKFIITAGHVAKSLATYPCSISVTKSPHKFTPQLAKINYRYIENQSIDYGYAEIPQIHHSVFTAGSRVFMSHKRLSVETANQLTLALDRMVIAGYAGAMMNLTGKLHSSIFMHHSTIISGTGSAPQSVLPPAAAGMQVVDLNIDRDQNINTTVGDFGKILLPKFGGISGGGCWRSGYQQGSEWVPHDMKLTAIHVASSSEVETNGRFYRSARQVLIGHHLRLIADDFSDLKGEIFGKWPQLEDDCWATGK
jgi:hypothetical protein